MLSLSVQLQIMDDIDSVEEEGIFKGRVVKREV